MKTIWYCDKCRRTFPINIGEQDANEHMDFYNYDYPVTCINKQLESFVPLASYEKLKSALEMIANSHADSYNSYSINIAKSALEETDE